MKIVVLDGYALNPGDISWEGFKALGEFVCYERTAPEETVERIGQAEIVITNKTVITKEIIDQCPNIRYIGVLATGFNVVDTAYAKEKGIPVTNIPDYSTNTVAQFVFALILEICNSVKLHSDDVLAGGWVSSTDFSYSLAPQIELFGKTLGVVGYGKIGKRVAEIGKAFGMNVIAHNRSGKIEDGNAVYADLDTLFAQSDFISLNCPLTQESTNLISKETIAKMKDGIVIINTARGPLVNEQDLFEGLESGKVRAFGADVLSTEPPKEDNPILKAKNCFITPHIAWAAKEARVRLMDIAVQNLKSFMEGNPVNTVN